MLTTGIIHPFVTHESLLCSFLCQSLGVESLWSPASLSQHSWEPQTALPSPSLLWEFQAMSLLWDVVRSQFLAPTDSLHVGSCVLHVMFIEMMSCFSIVYFLHPSLSPNCWAGGAEDFWRRHLDLLDLSVSKALGNAKPRVESHVACWAIFPTSASGQNSYENETSKRQQQNFSKLCTPSFRRCQKVYQARTLSGSCTCKFLDSQLGSVPCTLKA